MHPLSDDAHLSDDDRRRYARHIMLDAIGEAGQQKLAASSVLVVGAGGLGSALIAYLAAAGIGRIGVIDHDHVELSNLQRQIVHEHADQGRLKVESAADRISELNPQVAVDVYPTRLSEPMAAALVARYDVVADGCDDFTTRLVVNDACMKQGVALISGAVKGFDGQLATFLPRSPHGCYRCLMPAAPPEANRCREVGVAGPVCGIIGSMQALEVMKYLIGLPTLGAHWLRYEGLHHRQTLSIRTADPACPACGTCQSQRTHA